MRASAAEGVDHPGRHVVDRDIGRGRGAALRQLLENQGGIETAERRATDIFFHIYTAEAQRRCFPQRIDRENLILVPVARMRHHFVARKSARGSLKRALFFG